MQCNVKQSRAQQSKAKRSLSTGASREALVDNECFASLCCAALFCFALHHSGDERACPQLCSVLLCIALFRRRARLSTGASREAPVDNECFALFCSALLCSALHCMIQPRAYSQPTVSQAIGSSSTQYFLCLGSTRRYHLRFSQNFVDSHRFS